MFKWLKSFFIKTRKEKILEDCGCVCYCPTCGEPLNDESECQMLHADGIYEYTCASCGDKPRFHFGIAPVPIYWEDRAI